MDGRAGHARPRGGGRGHFAGALAAGKRAGGAVARRAGGAGGEAAHTRGVVPAVAHGEPGRQHAGRGRRGGQRGAFGRPGASRGRSAFPKVRFVSLVEGGTHVLFGTRMGAYAESELALSRKVLGELREGMLCLADRNFFGYKLWNMACSTGADLVWRLRKNRILPCERRLRDGSYLSTVHASRRERRQAAGGVPVRVVEYRLEGVEGAEPLYRLATSVLAPERAPARELAALCHERWEIETAFDELKTHLRGSRIVLRSKKPDLVRQEFYGLLLAHFAVRKAALQADLDPDRLSFLHAVRVVRRKLPIFAATPPRGIPRLTEVALEEILEERVKSSRGRRNQRAVKRKMSSYPLKRDQPPLPPIPDMEEHIKILN